MRLRYHKNIILIIGGSSEIGLKLAFLCINSNLFPVLTYRNKKGRDKIYSNLKDKTKFETYYLKLNDFESLKKLPEVDYLVDISQSNYESLVINASEKFVEDYISCNITFKAFMLKQITEKMKSKKFGRLIYISSAAVERINPGQGYYAATKSAVETLYKTCGIELGGLGITTTILRPGYIDSGRGKEYLENQKGKVKKIIPINRLINID